MKVFSILIIIAISCTTDSIKDFSTDPTVEFRDLKLLKGRDRFSPDTLVLKFYFGDKEMDIGLDPNETDEPYNYRWYFKKNGAKISDHDFVQSGNPISELITFDYTGTLGIDTFPSLSNPHACKNWEVVYENGVNKADTVYFQSNKNHYNLFIDFLTWNSNTWVPFDWSTQFSFPSCESSGFNGRVFRINQKPGFQFSGPFLIQILSPNEGIIQYKMPSFGFQKIAGMKIKLKVRLQDRALHASNEIETSEILIE
jgi:hypothetical protein